MTVSIGTYRSCQEMLRTLQRLPCITSVKLRIWGNVCYRLVYLQVRVYCNNTFSVCSLMPRRLIFGPASTTRSSATATCSPPPAPASPNWSPSPPGSPPPFSPWTRTGHSRPWKRAEGGERRRRGRRKKRRWAGNPARDKIINYVKKSSIY